MKKLSFIVMACLLVLGLTQCKKNETPNNNNTDDNRVSITLQLTNGGQKVHPEEENGLANVVYDNGDVVYVGSDGKYVGYLTYNGTLFTGSINAEATEGQPLQFIFMGGQTIEGLTENSSTECIFNIGNQRNGLAVISGAASNEDFSLTNLSYTAYLRNKCALVKFNLGETSTGAAIAITGMKTEATVGFDGTVTNGETTGDIVTYGTGSTRYAVVLSDQEAVTEGTVSAVAYEGTFSIPTAAYTNAFLTDATMTLTAGPLATPLTLEALTDGTIVVDIVNIMGGKGGGVYPGSSKGGPGGGKSSNISMKYSVNGGAKNLIDNTTTIPVAAGDRVQLYGNGPDMSNYYIQNIAGGTAQVKVYGNIMSMLDEDNYATLTTLQDYAFYGLFAGFAGNNTTLTDASGLLLPATTLTEMCYFGLFFDCTSLTTAPALPATELAEQCYTYMFNGCTSLTTAPTLPATTLAGGCYSGMFDGCTSLTTAPALPATTLANGCYSEMFYDCTGLTTAPALPATTLANSCYYSMFSGCTSLTTAPALPAETLASECYSYMFSGCTNLNSITCLATEGINENESTTDWVNGVASTGTFNRASGATWPTGNNGIPNGWTLVPPADLPAPLTLEALTAGNIVVNISGRGGGVYPGSSKGGPGGGGSSNISMKYSVNNGEKTLITTATTIPVNAGDKVQFYGNGTSTQVYGNAVMLQGTAQTKVYGNIMSLIDETGYATLTTLPNQDNVFMGLFAGNENLTDASGLLLPAETLANSCYSTMFSGCTSLTTAPTLPATELASSCYSNMFNGCTSLTTAPTLPATTLAGGCYDSMFKGCTNLTTAPALPATTLTDYCYNRMFQGCTSLTTAPALPAETLANYCYRSMFQGCTSLTTAPVLPATTLANYCYYNMFYGCTSLTTAPALPAETLASNCYYNMFSGCTSLTTAPALPATTLANYCYRSMFQGCTSLTTAPVLPATTLAYWCYYEMFEGCTSLNNITCLATAGINQNSSTYNWVNSVASTGTFTKASGSTWPEGSNGIPSGWTVNEQ